jgi:hypothetical protein
LGVERIVSGGQTGVDRAALDVAIELGIPHGGWCPRGRLAEDGVIPDCYDLTELTSPDYAVRTRQNVIDSDATLILYQRKMTAGTALTNRIAKEQGRPLKRVRLDLEVNLEKVSAWLIEHEVRTLNVAGPRGSSCPEIYELSRDALKRLFSVSPPLPV